MFRICLLSVPIVPFKVIHGIDTFASPLRIVDVLDATAESIVCHCLRDASGKPLLRSAASLPHGVAERLARELVEATKGFANRTDPDFGAFAKLLKEGARHVSNFYTAQALGSCVELLGEKTPIPRLDRFFGVPLVDLHDLNWEAYWVARNLFLDSITS